MQEYSPTLTIVCQSQESFELYCLVLEPLGFASVVCSDFDQHNLQTINSDIVCIDLTNETQMRAIYEFMEYFQGALVLLSPFSRYSFEISPKSDYFYVAKPIHFEDLLVMLKNIKQSIITKRYIKKQNALIVEMTDTAPVRMGVFDISGKLIYANKQYRLAYSITEIYEKITFDSLLHCGIDFEQIRVNLSHSDVYTREQEQDNKWFQSRFYYILEKNYIAHICIDVTDAKYELETLTKEALFFKYTNEGVAITNKNAEILSVNTAFCKITGYTKEEVIGRSTKILASGMHHKDFYINLWDSLKYHNFWQGEIWNRRKNGEIYPEWLSISAVDDPKTKEKTYMALFTDISSLKESDKKLHFYANHDHLTGLFNKAQFENMLTAVIKRSQRNKQKFALLFLDLDFFKEVNDTYGHNVGDLLLKYVASKFQSTLRSQDILARIGGDEFNIILEDISSEQDAIVIAQKLADSFKDPVVIQDYSCFVSLSIGVSIFPYHGVDAINLAKNADAAMYEVKKNGRNGIMVYNSKFTANLLERVSLQNDLKKMLQNHQIEVYFQPVIDAKTNTIHHAEALARWNHPQRGFISPEVFIPLAEQHGQIIELGAQILQKSLEYLQTILLKYPDFKLAINMSPREFFDDNYIINLVKKVYDFGLDPRHLELEITETHVMQNHKIAVKKLQELRDKGFTLTIDDFGTGYSSLNYLKMFPISKLKIDKSFVLNMLTDRADEAIVKSSINLAKIFGLEVQAEGVELSAHVDILGKMECDYLQGFYFSQALEFDSFMDFLEKFQTNV